MHADHSQMVFLPKQLDRLASIAAETGKAVGVSQNGTTLSIDTGDSKFDIDANGENTKHKHQEKLC